jgi:hypothetical protein
MHEGHEDLGHEDHKGGSGGLQTRRYSKCSIE